MKLHLDTHARELLVDGLPLDRLSQTELDLAAQAISTSDLDLSEIRRELAAIDHADRTVFTTLIRSIERALESENPEEWLASILDDAHAAETEFLSLLDALTAIRRLIDETD